MSRLAMMMSGTAIETIEMVLNFAFLAIIHNFRLFQDISSIFGAIFLISSKIALLLNFFPHC